MQVLRRQAVIDGQDIVAGAGAELGADVVVAVEPTQDKATAMVIDDDRPRRLAGAVQDGKLGILHLGDGREYRTLVRKALPGKVVYSLASVSPAGRLLAAAVSDGAVTLMFDDYLVVHLPDARLRRK